MSDYMTTFLVSDRMKLLSVATLLCGSTVWVLLKMSQGHFFGIISPETRQCLQKSSLFAIGSLTLGSFPVFFMRRLGWDMVQSFYLEFLFRNRYTSALTIILVILLSVFSIIYPVKSNKKVKYQLWAFTCLSVGTLLAPIVLTPRDLLTIVSGYTLSLTVPMAASCAISPNFLFLNASSLILTTLSTIFAHHIGIPWVIHRRHALVGTTPIFPSSLISTLLLGTVFVTAIFSMISTNLFVWHVQKCHEHERQLHKPRANVSLKPKGGVSRKGKIKLEDKSLLDKQSFSTSAIDGTDYVTNGLIIAGYGVFTFLRFWWDISKFVITRIIGIRRYSDDDDDE